MMGKPVLAVVVMVMLVLVWSEGCKLSKCELKSKLKDAFPYDEALIAKLVCTVGSISSFDTSLVKTINHFRPGPLIRPGTFENDFVANALTPPEGVTEDDFIPTEVFGDWFSPEERSVGGPVNSGRTRHTRRVRETQEDHSGAGSGEFSGEGSGGHSEETGNSAEGSSGQESTDQPAEVYEDKSGEGSGVFSTEGSGGNSEETHSSAEGSSGGESSEQPAEANVDKSAEGSGVLSTEGSGGNSEETGNFAEGSSGGESTDQPAEVNEDKSGDGSGVFSTEGSGGNSEETGNSAEGSSGQESSDQPAEVYEDKSAEGSGVLSTEGSDGNSEETGNFAEGSSGGESTDQPAEVNEDKSGEGSGVFSTEGSGGNSEETGNSAEGSSGQESSDQPAEVYEDKSGEGSGGNSEETGNSAEGSSGGESTDQPAEVYEDKSGEGSGGNSEETGNSTEDSSGQDSGEQSKEHEGSGQIFKEDLSAVGLEGSTGFEKPPEATTIPPFIADGTFFPDYFGEDSDVPSEEPRNSAESGSGQESSDQSEGHEGSGKNSNEDLSAVGLEGSTGFEKPPEAITTPPYPIDGTFFPDQFPEGGLKASTGFEKPPESTTIPTYIADGTFFPDYFGEESSDQSGEVSGQVSKEDLSEDGSNRIEIQPEATIIPPYIADGTFFPDYFGEESSNRPGEVSGQVSKEDLSEDGSNRIEIPPESTTIPPYPADGTFFPNNFGEDSGEWFEGTDEPSFKPKGGLKMIFKRRRTEAIRITSDSNRPLDSTDMPSVHGDSFESLYGLQDLFGDGISRILHGIFQLSDDIACQSESRYSLNICGMNCTDLTDDDITDDIACLRTLHENVMEMSFSEECQIVVPSEVFSECE